MRTPEVEQKILRFVKWLDLVAWPLGLLLTVVGLGTALNMIWSADGWPWQGTDLSVYLNASNALRTGQDMYDPATGELTNPYAYPPIFAEFLAVLMPFFGGGKSWSLLAVFGIGCLFSSLTLMMRHSGVKLGWKWVVLAFGALLEGRLARSDIFHVQPHFILLLLIVLGVRYFALHRILVGAILWGVVFCVKPFTGALAFGLMRNGNWRAATTTIAAAGVIFTASFLPFLPNYGEGVRGWMHASAYHTGLPNVTKVGNETIYGMLHRLIGAEEGLNSTPWIHLPALIPVFALALLLLGICGIWFGSLSKKDMAAIPAEERHAQALLQAAVVLGFAMSCGPLMEGPHVFMLLPGVYGSLIIAIRRWQQDSPVKWRWSAAAAMWILTFSFFLIPVNQKLTNFYLLGHITGPMIILTAKFGFLVLGSCIVSAFAQMGDRAVRADRPTARLSKKLKQEPIS